MVDENNGIRLVILKPHYAHARKDQNSPAMDEAKKMLNQRGNSPRTYRNTLIFLAADRTRIEELKQATRLFMAWDPSKKSAKRSTWMPCNGIRPKTRRKDAEERILALTPETYSWLLVPEQSNPRSPDYISEYKLQPQKVPGLLATNASKLLHTEELLITQLRSASAPGTGSYSIVARESCNESKKAKVELSRYLSPRLKNTEVLSKPCARHSIS